MPQRILLALLAGLILCGPDLLVAQPAQDTDSTPDARQVRELVDQLANGSYRSRQQAHERLNALGPKALPLLLPYRNHRNAEVRRRVHAIIEVNSWIRRGAFVYRVTPNSKAERLGLKPGDMLVKMDGKDYLPGDEILKDSPRVFTLLRGDKLVEMKVPPGKLGFWSTPWRADEGGQEFIRAILAYEQEKDYAKAHRWFQKAARNGLPPDRWPWRRMGAAEWSLDHAAAMALYLPLMTDGPNTIRNHYVRRNKYIDSPWYPTQTDYLVKRYQEWKAAPNGVFEVATIRRLGLWSVLTTHNLPLAREIRSLDWPEDLSSKARAERMKLEIALDVHDRNDARAIRTVKKLGSSPCSLFPQLGMRAATRSGDVEYAVEQTEALLDHLPEKPHTIYSDTRDSICCGIAMAYLAGRDEDAHRLVRKLFALSKNYRREILGSQVLRLLGHARFVDHILPPMEELLESDPDPALAEACLHLLAFAPCLTPEKWDRQWEQLGPRPKDRSSGAKKLRRLAVSVHLRFDRVEQAARWVDKKHGPISREQKQPTMDVIKFLRSSEARSKLDGPWKQLRGSIMLFADKRHKCRWLLRWDGRCFRLSDDGPLDEPTGLDRHMAFRVVCKEGIHTKGGLTRLNRRFQHYVFDDENDVWVKTWLLQGEDHAYHVHMGGGTEVPFLRHYLKHGQPGPGRYLLTWTLCKPYVCFQAGNDYTYLSRFGGKGNIFLNQKIGQLAGANRPARISTTIKLHKHPHILVYSDLGLWSVNEKGNIQRVELGLRDPNQWIVLSTYPQAEGKVYAGCLPQNGGALFEIDKKTLKVRRTNGYCGLGPRGAFAYEYVYHYRVSRMHEGCIVARGNRP